VEFSNPDIHSAIVEKRIAALQQEAEQDRLAHQASDDQSAAEADGRVHPAGLRSRLGHGLIALGQAIEGAEEAASDMHEHAHHPHASNDPQAA
jgi:hypothetical protein